MKRVLPRSSYAGLELRTPEAIALREIAQALGESEHLKRGEPIPDFPGTVMKRESVGLRGEIYFRSEKGSVQALSLRNCGLAALPEQIGGLDRLRDLRVGKNDLASAPDFLWRLTKLETLDLSENRLSSISSSIEALTGQSDEQGPFLERARVG